MVDRHVVAVEIARLGRPDDPHPAMLHLEDGRRVAAERVISDLRYGVEAYYAIGEGGRTDLRIVGPCPRCGLDYLRADAGGTRRDELMRLPVRGERTG